MQSCCWGHKRLTNTCRSISKHFSYSHVAKWAKIVQLHEHFTLMIQDSLGHLKTLCMSILSLHVISGVLSLNEKAPLEMQQFIAKRWKRNPSLWVWFQLYTDTYKCKMICEYSHGSCNWNFIQLGEWARCHNAAPHLCQRFNCTFLLSHTFSWDLTIACAFSPAYHSICSNIMAILKVG